MTLLAFDLDGTLTQHKSPIDNVNRNIILNLQKKQFKLVVVGAGSCSRIYSQLEGLYIDIIGNYGMQESIISQHGNLEIVRNDYVSVDKKINLERAKILRQAFNLSSFVGNTLEFHDSGMMTFPVLGTKASLDDKLSYDPDRKKRRAMYAKVCQLFDDYTVVIGGTSSFDIIPRPYNKYTALANYAKKFQIDHKDILYFGDDYGCGGNDSVLYKSDIAFGEIDDYRELAIVVNKYLTQMKFSG